MKHFYYLFFLINLLLFLIGTSYGQQPSDSLLNQWAEFVEDESNLAELLEELAENPVNINTNNREELLRIPLLSSSLTDSILRNKAKLGSYSSKRQIRPILGTELYNLIKDFISIKSKSKKSFSYIHKSYYGIEPIKQIENDTYKGDAFFDYNKLQYTWSDNFRFGLVTQKDIGEANYLDYKNGYAEYNSNEIKGIAGSFYMHFGEGLLFSNAYGQQKSSLATLPFRTGNEGGFATLSSSENTGLFGIFLHVKKVYDSNIYLFYSKTDRDAQFNQNMEYITGIDYDGYHRTDSELEKKNGIDESLIGMALSRSFYKTFHFGVGYSQVNYDPAMEVKAYSLGENSYRRQRFNFSGDQISQYNSYYALNLKGIELKGELAGSQRSSFAITQSIFMNSDKVNFGIKYWYVSKNFQSPYGRVFDNSNPFPQAEEGFYFGLALNPWDRFSINSFKIMKKDLWRTYFDKMPKMNDESFIELNYQPENVTILTRVRIRDNEYFTDPFNENPVIRKLTRQNIYRFQLDYKPAKPFLFRTRWEMTDLKSAAEKGSYIFEDIHYYPASNISIRTRVLFYYTDSYNSRLYEYESDLPGSYANYAVYGEGRVFYLMFNWKIFSTISVWLKYRYNYIIKKDLTPAIIRNDDNELQRSLRFQVKFYF